MASNTYKGIEFTIVDVRPPRGNGPTKVTVDCPSHPDVEEVEVWGAGGAWAIGNKLKASVYEKEYQGKTFFSLSKFDEVYVISSSSGLSGAEIQEKPTLVAVSPETASGGPSMDQQSASKKEKLITILALAKPVIQTGGSEDDLRRWLEIIENMVNE